MRGANCRGLVRSVGMRLGPGEASQQAEHVPFIEMVSTLVTLHQRYGAGF